MAVIVIFVEGADTEPDPLPVYILDNEEHAARICEGIGATEYRAYKFSFCEVGKADQSKFPFWAEMTIDARDGIYGDIVAGIYDMIDRAYAIISQRRVHQKPLGNSNGNTKSDGDSVLSSTKQEKPTKTDDNLNAARARQQLRPYVEITEFREYLKEQILKWETWHQSQVDEIRMHKSCRDHAKEQLENGIRQGTVDPDDPDDTYVLSYEWHKFEVSSIPKDLEFRLIAEREPICFQEASIAAMVALFWCDINRKHMVVPDYDKQPDFDFLDPYGTFQKYLFEQWEKPIQGRYKHIQWFVEAAIKVYESRIAKNGVDAAISLRMSDIAATELKPDELPNQNRISDDKATQQDVPSNVETAPLKTASTTDIGSNNSTKQAEQTAGATSNGSKGPTELTSTKALNPEGSIELDDKLRKDPPPKLESVDAESAIPKPLEPYKWKEFLAEDAWVYENIHANSFAELNVEHSKQCQSKKNFKKVLSRRAYWVRADRYADYHGLRKRRFKGACECPDCQTVTDTPLTPTDN